MSLINKVKQLYIKVPLDVINIFALFYYMIPSTLRYGSVFENQRKLLRELDKLSKVEIDDLVNKEFLSTVKYCYENVPYYHKLFDEHGISITSFRDIRDIVKIPFLTKELLLKHSNELVATNVDKSKIQYITTSGSTGKPVGFYVDNDSTMKEWAYTLHIWGRVGYKPDSSRLVLRGKVFREQKLHSKSWQYDALRRELSCNIFDMTEENMEQYCIAIEKYKPEFIHGYMSATMLLCKYIEKRLGGLRHQFKAILAASETVNDYQRKYVEQILNARVFSFYGHSERLVIAGECEYSKEYHIEPLYGIAEIVETNGNVIINNDAGELVTTGFCNKGMPMLRYKTGDITSWSKDTSCKCERHHIRLEGVAGRWKQDMLVNNEGALISLTAINMHSDVFDNIVKYQFYQDAVGKVIIKIVPSINFSDENRCDILYQLKDKTQGKITYEVEIVKDIPNKVNGKNFMVDQKLDTGMFNQSM